MLSCTGHSKKSEFTTLCGEKEIGHTETERSRLQLKAVGNVEIEILNPPLSPLMSMRAAAKRVQNKEMGLELLPGSVVEFY